MKRLACLIGASLVSATLAGCGEEIAEAPPPPHELSAEATGHYCGMGLLEHGGPKGQIILASRPDPIWFSSARDAVAFTMLPEEPKDIRAIYVSDMAKAPSWENPGERNWVEPGRRFLSSAATCKVAWAHLRPFHFRVGVRPMSSPLNMAVKLLLSTQFRAIMCSVRKWHRAMHLSARSMRHLEGGKGKTTRREEPNRLSDG